MFVVGGTCYLIRRRYVLLESRKLGIDEVC